MLFRFIIIIIIIVMFIIIIMIVIVNELIIIIIIVHIINFIKYLFLCIFRLFRHLFSSFMKLESDFQSFLYFKINCWILLSNTFIYTNIITISFYLVFHWILFILFLCITIPTTLTYRFYNRTWVFHILCDSFITWSWWWMLILWIILILILIILLIFLILNLILIFSIQLIHILITWCKILQSFFNSHNFLFLSRERILRILYWIIRWH